MPLILRKPDKAVLGVLGTREVRVNETKHKLGFPVQLGGGVDRDLFVCLLVSFVSVVILHTSLSSHA